MNYAAASLRAIGILKHFSHSSLRDQERGANIQGDHIVQMSFRDIHKGLGNIHPGIVQQDIQALDAGEGEVHLLALGHIANDHARATSRFGNAFCDLFEFATRSADQDHFRPGAGESKRSLCAEPATRSRDQCDAAIESKGGRDCRTIGRGRRGIYRGSPELVLTLTLRLP